MEASAERLGGERGGLLEAARERSEQFPWVWSFVGGAAIWLAIGITAGYGSIDLSVPNVMTLAGFVSVGIMDGGDGSFVVGVLAGIAVGLAVAVANVLAIELLAI